MISWIRFDSIKDHPIGDLHSGNQFYEVQENILNMGPRFNEKEWVDNFEVKGFATACADVETNTWHRYTGSRIDGIETHRTVQVTIDDTIGKQLRRVRGTIPIVHLIIPVHIQAIEKDNLLKEIADTFAPYKEVRILFSGTWDLYSSVDHTTGFDLIEYIKEQTQSIPQERIFVLSCNKEIVDRTKELMPNATAYNHNVYYNRIRVYNPNEYIPSKDKRTKHILNLNNRIKDFRKELYDFLPADKTYKTLVENGFRLGEEATRKMRTQNITSWQDNLPYKYYNDSYINLVSETYFYNYNEAFVPADSTKPHLYASVTKQPRDKIVKWHSEKTLKPLYFRQLFLIAGTYKTHEVLKEYGYKLFDNFIDYSFDDEVSGLERMKLLKTEITRLLNLSLDEIHEYYMSNECQSILQHNYNLFMKNSDTNMSEMLQQ